MSDTNPRQFAYAGLPLFGVNAHGVRLTVESTSGWYDGTEVRAAPEAKAGQDGDYDYDPHRQSRIVTLQGKAWSQSVAALEATARELAGLPLKGSLDGSSEWGSLSGAAVMEDASKFSTPRNGFAVWQMSWRLPDPVLYGQPTYGTASLDVVAAGTGLVFPLVFPLDFGVPAGVTPGAITLPNAGTATYWPRLRIDGPVTNPSISLAETGAWVKIRRTITAGQWIDVDLGNRRVLLNGQVSLGPNVTFSGNWLGVPPGGGSLSYSADTADPAARLSAWGFESAWN